MIQRMIIAFLCGAACAILASVALIVFSFAYPYCCSRFDSGEWRKAGQGTDWQITEKEIACVRGKMLDDLRTNHLKDGMSKDEMFSLLGTSTQSLADRANNCHSYSVGYCAGFGFDLNGVTFCFDAHERLLNRQGKISR